MHGVGFQDEDLDYELPDPYSAMHFKNKRSQVFMFLGGFVSAAIIIGYLYYLFATLDEIYS